MSNKSTRHADPSAEKQTPPHENENDDREDRMDNEPAEPKKDEELPHVPDVDPDNEPSSVNN